MPCFCGATTFTRARRRSLKRKQCDDSRQPDDAAVDLPGRHARAGLHRLDERGVAETDHRAARVPARAALRAVLLRVRRCLECPAPGLPTLRQPQRTTATSAT